MCGEFPKHSITGPITDPLLVFHHAAELFQVQIILFIREIHTTDLDSHVLKIVEGN